MRYTPLDEVLGGRVRPPEIWPPVHYPDDKPSIVQRHQGLLSAVIVGGALIGGGWLLSRADGEPDAPNPNPNLPTIVVDTQLSKLLPNQTARGQAASFFRDFSLFVERQRELTTTSQVIEASQRGAAMLQQTNQMQGWSAVNQPISDRIIKVLGGQPATGVPDLPLDQPMLNNPSMTPRLVLQREYAQIATDLRGT